MILVLIAPKASAFLLHLNSEALLELNAKMNRTVWNCSPSSPTTSPTTEEIKKKRPGPLQWGRGALGVG